MQPVPTPTENFWVLPFTATTCRGRSKKIPTDEKRKCYTKKFEWKNGEQCLLTHVKPSPLSPGSYKMLLSTYTFESWMSWSWKLIRALNFRFWTTLTQKFKNGRRFVSYMVFTKDVNESCLRSSSMIQKRILQIKDLLRCTLKEQALSPKLIR